MLLRRAPWRDHRNGVHPEESLHVFMLLLDGASELAWEKGLAGLEHEERLSYASRWRCR